MRWRRQVGGNSFVLTDVAKAETVLFPLFTLLSLFMPLNEKEGVTFSSVFVSYVVSME